MQSSVQEAHVSPSYPAAILCLLLVGCGPKSPPEPAPADRPAERGPAPVVDPTEPGSEEARHLVATVLGTDDHPALTGVVHLVRDGREVDVSAKFVGLPPGPHGWHVHV